MAPEKLYDIDTLLGEVVTLPSMPDSLARITKLISDPDCALTDVARAISSDPAIALKTLRLVNSAYYGLGQEVTTVEHAVVLLGIKVINNLVLTATVFETIKGAADLFLKHSVSCGVTMRVLAETGPLGKQFESPDEAFVFGLLHDIGKIILAEFLPEEYQHIVDTVKTQHVPWYQAERHCIGVDHAMVGSQLAHRWKLPASVVHAIAGHHDLSQCSAEGQLSASSLAVADYLCSASGMPSYRKPSFDIPDECWAAAGLTSPMIPKVIDRFMDSLPDIDELIKLAA